MRRYLAQRGSEVGRGMIPQRIKLCADNWPVFDAVGRRGNDQAAGVELPGEASQDLDQAHPEPSRGPYDNREVNDRYDHCCELRSIAKMFRKPVVRRIQSHGEYEAPSKDGNE